jgi:hypothetical protein
MRLSFSQLVCLAALLIATVTGCKVSDKLCFPCADEDLTPSFNSQSYLKLEDACIEDCPQDQVAEFVSPLSLEDFSNVNYLSLTLDQCVEMAVRNNKIMRDLGGPYLDRRPI